MLSPQEICSVRRQGRLSAALSFPTYALLILAGRLYFRYRFKGLSEFRRKIWDGLKDHPGPVIWAANHLTLIDSFLVFWAVFPLSRAWDSQNVPWSTPEYTNYYRLGGPVISRLIRALLYLCRCIPFLRQGDDEAAARVREKAFEKCVWILKGGGSVFVYPEAGRSRSGWLDPRRPKDFLGRLALEVPETRFLCIYLRGDRQLYTTVTPLRGETFRALGELIPGVLPGETTPRAVSARLFAKLGELQNQWFAAAGLPKNCGGNDVVDVRSALASGNIDPETGQADEEWLDRHLTPREREHFDAAAPAERFRVFWRYFAAKEAAYKALSQSGISTPSGAFRLLEADLFRRRVLHLPTGAQTEIQFTDDDADKIHCLAVLRGGGLGDDEAPGDVLWRVEEVPPGTAPGTFARERCLKFIAESSAEPLPESSLAFTLEDGIPKVLRGGRPCDWGVSISHSGRFAAYSFMIS